MHLADKIRHLRYVEGHLRGLDRKMSQKEVVAAIRSELAGSLSQPYLSQIENGQRVHLTEKTRLLLSQFFKVHPGYLVEDPEGFQTELLTDLGKEEMELDDWLIAGAERFRKDPYLAKALLTIAQHDNTRHCLLVLATVLQTPDLLNRLADAVLPQDGDAAAETKEESRDLI